MEKTTNYPGFSPRKCNACWKCVDICPRHTIKKVKILWHRHAVPTYHGCIGCNLCVRTCPNGCFTSRD